MSFLAEHYTEKRNTTKTTEVNKIQYTEEIRRTLTRHTYYLKEKHGMIRAPTVPDHRVHQVLALFGVLAWIALMGAFGERQNRVVECALLVGAVSGGSFTVWGQLTTHGGWKILTGEALITKRILQRNGTHLSMSKDTSFTRGRLITTIDLDGEAAGEMLKERYDLDTTGMDEIHASEEMKEFLAVLKYFCLPQHKV